MSCFLLKKIKSYSIIIKKGGFENLLDFIDNIAMELRMSFPNLKGFSVRNLKYMKAFYIEYKDDDEFVQLVAQLPWKHNITLMQKIKDKDVRKWYMNKCLEEGWSDSILIYQIETNLYERQEKAVKHNNFNLTLKQNSDLANNMMKEPYVFDLIELTSDYKEKELENKMLERIKNVLLELGNGFSFVGNQYKVTVDNQDFYIDLLFYHIKLKCYFAVELKVVEFKPEFAGKMEFYLTALDEEVKDENDNSSIGIILCQNKSNKIVDYTLKYINKPVGVSEYKILDKLSDDILNKLPTEEDINLHIDVD
jgi:predicted nuclease of restriction endonuclease-like (RecB) superfamily